MLLKKGIVLIALILSTYCGFAHDDDTTKNMESIGQREQVSKADSFAKVLKHKRVSLDKIYRSNVQSAEVYQGSSTGKIPRNYVLDAGDEIAVNIVGISQAYLVYQIDKDGFIRPSSIPKIYLKGVTLEQAKEIIIKRFKTAYRYSDDQVTIDLKTARTH
ncbi:MAG: hypothetical protein COA58_13525 [Bacteroidetes bacterium]|nr:MAG: hypothetical protein COA58_13525 [Bacteroidota bacterium]